MIAIAAAKLNKCGYIQLVFATNQANLGSAELALWAGLDFFVCFNRRIFRRSFFNGVEKENRICHCFAFYLKSYFQLRLYTLAVWVEE